MPTVTAISPTTAAFGDSVTVTGTGFLATGNMLKVSEGYISQVGTSDGATVRFQLAQVTGVCAPTLAVCPTLAIVLNSGTYGVQVANVNGTSNAVTLQIAAR